MFLGEKINRASKTALHEFCRSAGPVCLPFAIILLYDRVDNEYVIKPVITRQSRQVKNPGYSCGFAPF